MIHFNPNEPQVLSLKDPGNCCPDGFNVLFETTSGDTLQLPRPAAVKLLELDPQPGEELSILKHREEKAPAEWVISLTARSEQARAAREAEEAERIALEQAAASRRDTGK